MQQVEVIRTYTAKQPDELSLQVADVVLISQTVEDGMFLLLFSLTKLYVSIWQCHICLYIFAFFWPWQQTNKKTSRKHEDLKLRPIAKAWVCFLYTNTFHLSGWYEGERLRDGERGWFLAECTESITCQATIMRNMQRMDRLKGLETCLWPRDMPVTCLFKATNPNGWVQ